jgi:L-fuculose-phosphate aldolase
MVRIGRLMWEKGFVAATDGNLSARLGADRLLVTASGLCKGFLSPEDLVVIRLDGTPLQAGSYRGRGKQASSEIKMHVEVYAQRPDVEAVVHAHPPVATAFSIAGVSLARCVLPEVIVTLGGIPTVSYATPGTAEVPSSIQQVIRDYDAVVLAHHGSLTVGSSLWEAYLRLEKVEHSAQITLAAHQLGRVTTLSPEAVTKLAEMRHDLLQREGRDFCEGCSVCLMGDGFDSQVAGGVSANAEKMPDEAAMVRRISEKVLATLRENS